MGIREKINDNPAITTGATILVIVLAIFAIWYTSCADHKPKISSNVFFTVDDGASWFPANASNVPPFTDPKTGKEAVRCWVYSCNGKETAGYLEKYSDEGKKMMQGNGGGRPRLTEIRNMPGHMVKKPKDANAQWIDTGNDPDDQARDIMHVTCPDSSTPMPVSAP